MPSQPGARPGSLDAVTPISINTDDFTSSDDESGRFDHKYIGRLLVLRWGLTLAYVSLVVTGFLPVRDIPFVAGLSWYLAGNLLYTWVWMQRRPIVWHDRIYLYLDLVTVVTVMLAVSNMQYPIWACFIMLMLAGAAEHNAVASRVYSGACLLAFIGTVVFLDAMGWEDVSTSAAVVTTVILAFIAYDLATTFEGNRRLRRYIRRLTVTDPLTQIANRRRLSALLASPPNVDHPLAVAIMDVDKFKQYNDSFGHFAGDRLLQRLAEILKEEFPSAIMVSRYGGDEFVIVIAGDSADKTAGDIFRALNEHPIDPMAVSVGVAIWPDEQPTLDAALALADDRLRLAKKSRRSTRKATVSA
ncbi:MAG TPA: GGDEF domain-containing protein [Dehalococcoidia bacterium]|nr:GGDEF domain-containing protein [Dehalococcoidia bacterium]